MELIKNNIDVVRGICIHPLLNTISIGFNVVMTQMPSLEDDATHLHIIPHEIP